MIGKVLLPSLGRPQLVKRFFEAYTKTMATIGGMVIIDKTDPKYEEYNFELPAGWEFKTTIAQQMGDKFREIMPDLETLDYIIILNDDHIPETEYWDEEIKKHIRGNNYVSTNDGDWQCVRGAICGAIAISGNVYRKLGWIFPEGVNHLFSDDAWATLINGAQSECYNYLDHVRVKHEHAYLGKKEDWDETTKKINGDGSSEVQKSQQWVSDQEAFNKWRETNLRNDIIKLRSLAKKRGVMIATPFHDQSCTLGYKKGIEDAKRVFHQIGQELSEGTCIGSSLLGLARNALVETFEKSSAQKLMFIDADQAFSGENILRLLNSSRRIIAGITPHKRFPINLNFVPLKEHEHYFKDLTNKGYEEFKVYAKECANVHGEIEVERVGTGFMMIDKSVFNIMREHVERYQPFDYVPYDWNEEFFIMKAADGKFHGEDWYFCKLAKELNIPIYINCLVSVGHQGEFIYGIPPILPEELKK